jgi:hypothetical protein
VWIYICIFVDSSCGITYTFVNIFCLAFKRVDIIFFKIFISLLKKIINPFEIQWDLRKVIKNPFEIQWDLRTLRITDN